MIKTDSIASGVFDFHVTWSSHLMSGTFNALIDSGNCFRYIDRERETCLWTLNIQCVRVPHRVAHRLERRSGLVGLTSVFPTAAAKTLFDAGTQRHEEARGAGLGQSPLTR